MGGNDVYCCFCGALACKPFWEPDEQDEDESYDPAVLQPEDTAWMDEVRLIGQNPYSKAMNKVFVSGPARYEDSSFFEVERSDDPNFPTPEQLESLGETTFFHTYDTNWGLSVTIPFHLLCFQQIFPRTVRYIESKQRHPSGTIDEVDKNLLYEALASLCPADVSQCLNIDYGSIADNQDQYWPTIKGEEAFVTSPDRIDGLNKYYSRLCKNQAKDQPATQYSKISELKIGSDPFTNLPAEVLIKILGLLPMASVNSLRAASAVVQILQLSNAFWKHRVLKDMPWLYDLPLDELEKKKGEINWATIYNDMLRHSEENSPIKINGLVNRRRIWGICEKIATVYLDRLENFISSSGNADAETLRDASASAMLKVLSTKTAKFYSFRSPIVQNWEEISHIPLLISAEWNESGILETLTIHATSEERESYTVASIESQDFIRKQSAKLPKGDWISCLVLTLPSGNDGCHGICGFEVFNIDSSHVLKFGDDTGNKRLLKISPKKVIVGIQGETAEGLVSGLSLLEATPPETTGLGHLLRSMSKSPYSKTQIQKYMWKDKLPPPNISVSRFEIGYWDSDSAIETSPVECLIFGQQEQDLSAITRFTGDFHLGGFRVEYSDRPAKQIGPFPHAMSVFTIDGARGERITQFSLKIANIPKCLSLRTNWGRIGVFGYDEQNHDRWQDAPRGKTIVGIAGIWEAGRPTRLTSAALVAAPLSAFEAPQIHSHSHTEDSEGRIWEPSPPPLHWKEAGPIFGNNSTQNGNIDNGGNHKMPTDTKKISWLNLCKPVAKVEVWFTHPVNALFGQQFISLIFQYPDNSRAAIGPQEFNVTVASELPACDCKTYVLPRIRGKSVADEGGGMTLLRSANASASGGDEEMTEVQGDDDDEEKDDNALGVDKDEDTDDVAEAGDKTDVEEDDDNTTTDKSDQKESSDGRSDPSHNEQISDNVEYTTNDWPYPRQHIFPGKTFHLAAGGEKIQRINIWSSVFLDGFQFISESGTKGPKWGTCKGIPTASIVFDPDVLEKDRQPEPKGRDDEAVAGAVGLKVFVGRNARPVTHEDLIFYGLQALVVSDLE